MGAVIPLVREKGKHAFDLPRRRPNAELRTREYLTQAEVEQLIEAAKANRWGHRDATMVLVAYRHGLRASELVDLRWEQLDFNAATLHVRRAKKATPATHPVMGDELRALRRLQREQEPKSPFVFTSERGSPFTTAGFAVMIERAAKVAKLPVATPWPTEGTTPGRCRPTSGIEILRTRFAIPSWHRRGSRIFGETNALANHRG